MAGPLHRSDHEIETPASKNLAPLDMNKSSRKKRGKALRCSTKGKLTIRQLLAWADAHHNRTGRWPKCTDGLIKGGGGERWHVVHAALCGGWRGLSGGTTLARLLAAKRGAPYPIGSVPRSPLTKKLILEWARAHYERTGVWPSLTSGAVVGVDDESWSAVGSALYAGSRGLPKGGSLAQLIGRRIGGSRNLVRPRLTAKQVLAWADDHHHRTGKWPTQDSGPVSKQRGEHWGAINAAMNKGTRGFRGGDSLVRFLARLRGVSIRRINKTPLTVKQILAWADAHHNRTGEWPTGDHGRITAARNETWQAVGSALRKGIRGLPGDTTLAFLLYERRNVPYPICSVPGRPLTKKQILTWAKEHHQRTGVWPSGRMGPVHGVADEAWRALDRALRKGSRGLPGGESLSWLLRGVSGGEPRLRRPKLTYKQILIWADAHRRKEGDWPNQKSGPVADAPGESWGSINTALAGGLRGLRSTLSLAQLLTKYRGVPYLHRNTGRLTLEQILSWADAHHARTGKWPKYGSGPIAGTEGETWLSVHTALQLGGRGLRPGWSLARLLAAKRGSPYKEHKTTPLTIPQILKWADAHHERTGAYPIGASGAVEDAPGEEWGEISAALSGAHRSLPGGSSLARLLAKHRGVRNRKALLDLSTKQILAWADAHLKRTGELPGQLSGPIPESNGETWMSVAGAMKAGRRGMKRGVSLTKLLAGRGPQVKRDLPRPKLTSATIALWAKAHCRRTGDWPDKYTGRVTDAPDETWLRIDAALAKGLRGLDGGSSLAELLKGRRKPKPLSTVKRRHRLRVL